MKNLKNTVTAVLPALLITQLAMVPSFANATAGSATLSLSEKFSAWYNRTLRSTKAQKKLAEDAGIETDPAKASARQKSTAGGDIRKEYKADASILKDVNAKIYSEDFLAKKPNYIGRDELIHRSIVQMNDGSKPNLVITGEPGSGKTSMVRQLARYLHKNWRQIDKMGKPIFMEIDVSSLVAGTTYRGEMEDKVKALLQYLEILATTKVKDEVTGQMVDQTVIVYFDEIHQLMSAGRDSSGSSGVAEMFKPFLTDGTEGARVRVIGSTTRKEYKYLKNDGAIERRFGEPVDLVSPTTAEAIAMVQDNAKRMEAYYGVKFPLEILELFVHKAQKYVRGLVLPDPALDMMNRAGAAYLVDFANSAEVQVIKSKITSLKSDLQMNLGRNTPAGHAEAAKVQDQIQALMVDMDNAEKAWSSGRKELMAIDNKARIAEAELKALQKQHLDAVMDTKSDDLAKIKSNQDLVEQIEIKRQALVKMLAERKILFDAHRENLPVVSREQAVIAIADRTGVDRTVLMRTLQDDMRMLREDLPRTVPGQARALSQIGRALSMGFKGLKIGKARAVLTVVDDTNQIQETVRAIDHLVYGAKNGKEVREAHLKTLIVDFNQRGTDFEQIKKLVDQRPHRAIAFLNVENADPTTLKRLVEAAETGRVELGNFADSNLVDFSDSVLLFHYGTIRNLPTQVYSNATGDQAASLTRAVTEMFKAAGDKGTMAMHFMSILQRSDSLVQLRKPTWFNLARIIERRVSELNDALKTQLALPNPVQIKISRRGVAYRLAAEANEVDGIDRVINTQILQQLNELIDAGVVRGGEVLELSWDGQRFVFFK